MIAIIDYGLSNLLSIKRAVDLFNKDNCITDDLTIIAKAEKIILPGVGAFQYGMKCMKEKGLDDAVKKAAKAGIPILGICLGMQMLFEDSEEDGMNKGLGLIPGHVVKIPGYDNNGKKQAVPHIGWECFTNRDRKEGWLDILEGVKEKEEVYFVHSYQGIPVEKQVLSIDVTYGGRNICAIVQKEKIIGCQFHPEKSGKVGLKILKNFINGM